LKPIASDSESKRVIGRCTSAGFARVIALVAQIIALVAQIIALVAQIIALVAQTHANRFCDCCILRWPC